MRQQWLVFLPVTLATAGLAACASVLGGEQVKIRPVDNMATFATAPRDTLYESAVSAIDERDYGRALEYLQAAKAKDPRSVKALNALGVVYDKLGRFDLSARYYAQARAIEPESRIVAENIGYSRVLQRLLNPNQSVAVASVDLPAGLTNPASVAGTSAPASTAEKTVAATVVLTMPIAEKKLIDTPPPTVTAMPLALPDAGHILASFSFPEPVMPVTERKVIDTPLPTLAAMPLALPDAGHMLASFSLPEPVMPVTERKVIDTPLPTLTAMPLALPDAGHMLASVSLPEQVIPVAERKLIDTPPPTVTAMPLVLPDARHLFASAILPEALVPVTERKLIDTPPPTLTAMPLALPDEKHLFASVTLPEPVVPVTEKKVIEAPARTVTAAPFALPNAKPLFAASLSPAVLSLPLPAAERTAAAEPTASAATMMAALSPARPAATISSATVALVTPVMERKIVVESALHAVTVPVAAPAKPVIAATPISVSPPEAEAKSLVVSVPAVPAIAGPARAKPVIPASMPEKKIAASHVPAVAAAPLPMKRAMPVPAARSVAEKPVRVASTPVIASARLRAAVPVAPVKQVASIVKNTPAKGKVLTIGQPIKLLNASGKPGGAGTVLRRLTTLGWTMRPADSRVQPATVLFYPAKNLAAAKAMQRTLPFPVRLIAESGKAPSMRLVIGRDYLSWKPKNSRIAVLWQKHLVIASSQKLSLRGVR